MPDQKASRWTSDDIPDLSGKTIVVTGGNSGIGYEAALEFARKRAKVVLACRDLGKARTAAAQIVASAPTADVEVMALDLSNLASIRGFADAFHMRHQALHVLCNNAGVMAIPYRLTADGFEMQFGTNHLGHFALTGLLLPRLNDQPGARVVTVSSNNHKAGQMRFDDLQGEQRYSRWGAYAQSKLANLLFAFELDRRLKAGGRQLISVAAHPGYSATNLQLSGPPPLERFAMRISNRLFAQSAEMGALPLLFAATAPDLNGGSYVGPKGVAEIRGYPVLVHATQRANDKEAGRRLWEISERLTGVSYDLAAK